MAINYPMGRYDANLGDIMQDVRRIDRFLDVVFEFLHRRTDFYQIMKHEDDKMGLPSGVARKYVMQAYMKYEQLSQGTEIPETRPENRDQPIPEIPEGVASEVEVTATDVSDLPGSPKKVVPGVSGPTTSPSPASGCPSSAGAGSAVSPSPEPCSSRTPSTNPDTGEVLSGGTCSGQRKAAKTEQAPSGPRLNPADTFNGALRENYAWSQTLKDVDVKVFVPSSVTKGKQLRVEVKNDSIKVAVKGASQGSPEEVLMDGQFTQAVRGEETIWSLEPGRCVQLNLEKRKETWWKAAITGEPEIDQQNIDNTQYVHEMDEDSQVDYQRVMYDMERKRQGLPTSKEQEAHDMLRKAWDAEGSPFKGQEFDPSSINISGS